MAALPIQGMLNIYIVVDVFNFFFEFVINRKEIWIDSVKTFRQKAKNSFFLHNGMDLHAKTWLLNTTERKLQVLILKAYSKWSKSRKIWKKNTQRVFILPRC